MAHSDIELHNHHNHHHHEVSPLLLNFGHARIDFHDPEQKRSSFRRSSKEEIDSNIVIDVNAQRFYYKNQEAFNRLLNIYNNTKTKKLDKSDSTGRSFECAGKVNVIMKMCTRCRDAGKKRSSKDKYYIDKSEVAQSRTILCRGCIGSDLRKIEQSKKR